MVTSVALGLVIAFEPHEIDVMRGCRAAVNASIMDGFGVWRIAFVGSALLVLTLSFFFWMKSQNASDDLARTVAVNALVIGQVFYLLNSRFKFDSSLSLTAHRGNRYLPLGIGAVVVLQLLLTYAPPLQVLFDTQAMPLWVWPWLVLGGFLFFLIVEAEKLLIRTIRASRGITVTANSASSRRSDRIETFAATLVQTVFPSNTRRRTEWSSRPSSPRRRVTSSPRSCRLPRLFASVGRIQPRGQSAAASD